MASTPGLSSYRFTSSSSFIPADSKNSKKAMPEDITDKFDVSNKETRYRSDADLIRFMGSNSSRRDFDNFGKIRNTLEGRDKSLFEMSALRGVSMLGELNSLFKYYDLSSVEGTAFLDAFSELGEDEMKMLIEIRQSYGPTGSKDKEKYILASGLSILSKEDQSNFIKAVHKNPDKINEIYELAFGMTEKDRSRFLSAAANSGSSLEKLIDLTNKFAETFLNKADLNSPLFVGYSSEGKLTSFIRFNDKGPVFENTVYQSVLAPAGYTGSDTEAMKTFSKFLETAEKSGKSVDDLMELMDRFDFQKDSKGIFAFIRDLSSQNAENFTDSAKDLNASGISDLMERTKGFTGKDRLNFLKSAANADENYKKFLNRLDTVESNLVSSFLSAAAKSGENINKFIDMTSQLDNGQLKDLLEFMEELSEKNASKLLEKEDISLEDLNSLTREISILDQNKKSAVLNTIINKDLSIDETLKASQEKTNSEKNEFFQNILDTYYKGVNEIL